MKISKKWLKELVDYKANLDEFIDDMENIGHELESVKPLVETSGLVIGEVLKSTKHPNADRLSVCEVNIGNEVLTIVCGAPNVRAGLKVIVAPVGVVLPGDFKIGKAKLKGIESNGMICSFAELGFESKFLTEQDKEEIHELPADAPVGENALAYLHLDDLQIDFDITPNRADMQSMQGFMREVSSLYGLEHQELAVDITGLENEEKATDYVSVNVDTKNCDLYLARVIKNVQIKESPAFIKARLIAAGIRPINNVVDISNYVMLAVGQPLHFFDLDKLSGKISVRMAKENEVFTTLDGVERVLAPDNVVIVDGEGVVALAGVMGGLETEVTDQTKNILIESAIFSPLSVRSTASKILRSESSNRFEKGICKDNTYKAIDLAAKMLKEYADAEIVSGIVSIDNTKDKEITIELSVDKIGRLIGTIIEEETINNILTRLRMEFSLNDGVYVIKPPKDRLDLLIAEDIIEEIVRIYGINKIPSILPTSELNTGSLSHKRAFVKNVNKFMEKEGLHQVNTYTLINDENEQSTMFNEEEHLSSINVLSPLSKERSQLRTTLLPSLVEVMEYNQARNTNDIMIYETSEVYGKWKHELSERTMLAGLVTGSDYVNAWQGIDNKLDFYVLKGKIENLFDYLGFSGRYAFWKDKYDSFYHPHKTATIYIDNTPIGVIGALNPKLTKDKVYCFEIDLTILMDLEVNKIKHQDAPKYPSIIKDVAFIVNQDVQANDIICAIKRNGGADLVQVEVFDVYSGENVEANKKSIAFKLTFQNQDRTLTDEEVLNRFNKIIAVVTKELDAKVRDK